jgi:hypothetical protein
MKSLATTCALIVGCVLTAGNAAAAPTNNFASADVNRDRALSRAEACAGKTRSVCKNFDRIDANRDGAVTRAEIRAFNNGKRIARGLPPKP